MRTPAAIIAALLASSCAVEPDLQVPDDPIDVGKGDQVANPSPHFTQVAACDAAFAEAGTTAESLSAYWECLLVANDKAARTLSPIVDSDVAGEHEALEGDFEELCRGAGLRSTNPDGVTPICGVAMTRDLASLFDAFAKFGTFDRVANDPDQTFTAVCYEQYTATIGNATTAVAQAEISSKLRRCIDRAIDQVMTTKIKPGLVTAGVSDEEAGIIDAAFQHINVRAGVLCGSFVESLAPTGSPGSSVAFRLSATDRCVADAKSSALANLAFFHDRFADRVPTRLEFTATPDLAIPDGADRGVDVDLEVTGVTGAKALTIALDITHSFPADLVVELRKDGTTIKTLLDHDDNAPSPLRTTFTLAAAEVGPPNGTWTLHVVDPWAVDSGRINSVTLSFE